jgi:CHAT domain-containing protein
MLLEQNATGHKFLSEISQHSLIHFSGHGSLGSILFLSGPFSGFPFYENEEFSDMQRAERFEGVQKINMMEEWHPVTDLDLFDIPITEGAVVFLNACETGQHKYAGEYFRGFPAVFLKNGAHSVISSLVPIFDEYSKEFALHFYDILLKTHSVAKSLKKAREWIKDIYEAPIYWVPYIHYGPPL